MKAAASLTGSLLARKGAAYPASYSAPSGASEGSDDSSAPERAYNDPRVIASATPSAEVQPTPDQGPQMQDGRFVEDLENAGGAKKQALEITPEAVGEDAGEGEDGSLPQAMDKMGRVRMSVRLDPDRYLRVKMASARTRWSAQDIVIAALDKFLEEKNAAKGNADAEGDEETD